MGKIERFEGQESLPTVGGPTGYLCLAKIPYSLHLSTFELDFCLSVHHQLGKVT